MYCSNCGNEINENSNFCPVCGEVQTMGNGQNGQYDSDYANDGDTNNNYSDYYNGYNQGPMYKGYDVPRKSRLAAGLLQIFLGWCGVGRFYLGYTGMGVAQLLTTFLCGIGCIWGFIDGILILCGQVECDAKGVPLRD